MKRIRTLRQQRTARRRAARKSTGAVLGEGLGAVAALLGVLALATWPVATLAGLAVALVVGVAVRRSGWPATDEQPPANVTTEPRPDPR